ncbi:hypothetical protein BDW59DRAFT_35404 [Aspergillus cavernicola]|uniref:Zn(2)-C6 fungal-type domain-containing protein n=1 Tax=Aspergillus cavernicola TaxID=176166 RepID=A0ABR4HBR3_9EURO
MNSPPLFTDQPQQDSPTNGLYRPYRSKRLRPCDTCRRRKVACRIESQPPCTNCSNSGIDCSFESPPVKRRRVAPTQAALGLGDNTNPSTDNGWNDGDVAATSGDMLPGDVAELRPWDLHDSSVNRMNPSMPMLAWNNLGESQLAFNFQQETNGALLQELVGTGFSDSPNGSVQQSPNPETSTQRIRSLDKREGFSCQYFGLSGESDPYLLRHFRFPSDGETRFFKVHFRSLAAEGRIDDSRQLPVHFMVSSDELGNAMKSETTFGHESPPDCVRSRLDRMVSTEDGQRLVGLFLRFVFPSFPVISRSELGMTGHNQSPSISGLSNLPPHLLAAVYAISIQFCHYDPVLCVSNVYTKPPTDQLWKLALEEILREIHTPHLSVMQAVLLYLQKPQVEMSGAVVDSPFRWSFMSIATSLASTLGLHLECRHWPIPQWEKRLRRRLWWAVYSESAWRSLLLGFPNHIHDDHWAVEEIDEMDFLIDGQQVEDAAANQNHPVVNRETHTDMSRFDFFYLTRLARIASEIYWKFYTLRATSLLSKDLHSSLNVARPLRIRLDEWYSALPQQYKIQQDSTSSMSFDNPRPRFAAYLRLSYLTLELLIYRALLRPLGSTVPESTGVLQPTNHESTVQQCEDLVDDNGVDTAVEATCVAAEGCAALIVSYVAALKSRDFNSFWFSWSRVCFSTMSNYTVTLLLQAPSLGHAQTAKTLVDEWLETLRTHSPAFAQVRLGLLRLDVMHWVGLRNLSRVSPWADAVLRSQDTP